MLTTRPLTKTEITASNYANIDCDADAILNMAKAQYIKGFVKGVEKAKAENKSNADLVEVVRCKNCRNRFVVNVCPYAGYYTTISGSPYTSTSTAVNAFQQSVIKVYCNAKDDDFCSRGELKDDDD